MTKNSIKEKLSQLVRPQKKKKNEGGKVENNKEKKGPRESKIPHEIFGSRGWRGKVMAIHVASLLKGVYKIFTGGEGKNNSLGEVDNNNAVTANDDNNNHGGGLDNNGGGDDDHNSGGGDDDHNNGGGDDHNNKKDKFDGEAGDKAEGGRGSDGGKLKSFTLDFKGQPGFDYKYVYHTGPTYGYPVACAAAA